MFNQGAPDQNTRQYFDGHQVLAYNPQTPCTRVLGGPDLTDPGQHLSHYTQVSYRDFRRPPAHVSILIHINPAEYTYAKDTLHHNWKHRLA
jgi:hypothetical protein